MAILLLACCIRPRLPFSCPTTLGDGMHHDVAHALASIADSLAIIAQTLAHTRIGGIPAQMDAIPQTREVAAVAIDEAVARWADEMTGDGRSPLTITVYKRSLRVVTIAAGWQTVAQVRYDDAMAFLAAKRRGDAGKRWGASACHQTICALKSFGEYLRVSGTLNTNPFADLKLPKRRGEAHKHPLSADEARRLLSAAISRHNNDGRAEGCAPLVWFCMMYTGLRHSEVASMRWGDVTDGGIWTDPTLLGNKSKLRDWIPLHPTLATLLQIHRQTVPSGVTDPVFPVVPTRKSFRTDRDAAGLPAVDADRRTLSVHSCRAAYCTWLSKLSLPEGLTARLARHALGITEVVYVTRDRKEMAAAITQLPCIWPDCGIRIGEKIHKPDSSPLTGVADIVYVVPVTSDANPNEQRPPANATGCDNLGECGGAHVQGGADSVESAPSTAQLGSKAQAFGPKPADDELRNLIRVLVRAADLLLTRASQPEGTADGRGNPTI